MRASIICIVLQLSILPSLLRAEPPAREQAASIAAIAWLKLVDDGNAAENWQALAAPTKESIPQWKWELAFGLSQRKFGSLSAHKLRSAHSVDKSPGGRTGEFVLLEYDTMSTKQGPIVEKLTMTHEPDGQWRVGGYTASK